MMKQLSNLTTPVSIIAILLWQFCAPVTAYADSTTDLFNALHARLSYMQSVAEYKEIMHLPIEDLAREAIVLEEAKQGAAAAGLQPDSVAEFFATQLTVAKIIQYRHRAALLSGTESTDIPDLENIIRPALDDLGSQINLLLASRIKEIGNITETDWPLFNSIIEDEYLDTTDERTLFEGLLLVRAQSAQQSN